jgi:hypothetical protein
MRRLSLQKVAEDTARMHGDLAENAREISRVWRNRLVHEASLMPVLKTAFYVLR